MNTYENFYFGFRVHFTPEWRVRSASNPNAACESNARYQKADDDLPIEDNDFRTVLFAYRRNESGSSIFSSRFSIVAHRHINGFDLINEATSKSDLLEYELSSLKILSRDAQVLRMVQGAEDYSVITKIVAWQETPGVWLSISADGDSLDNFMYSEKILCTMTWLR